MLAADLRLSCIANAAVSELLGTRALLTLQLDDIIAGSVVTVCHVRNLIYGQKTYRPDHLAAY